MAWRPDCHQKAPAPAKPALRAAPAYIKFLRDFMLVPEVKDLTIKN
jgi:hypothetical protein